MPLRAHSHDDNRDSPRSLPVRLTIFMATLVDLIAPAGRRDEVRWLFANLSCMRRVSVTFSDDADSAYPAWAANRVLGAKANAALPKPRIRQGAVTARWRLL